MCLQKSIFTRSELVVPQKKTDEIILTTSITYLKPLTEPCHHQRPLSLARHLCSVNPVVLSHPLRLAHHHPRGPASHPCLPSNNGSHSLPPALETFPLWETSKPSKGLPRAEHLGYAIHLLFFSHFRRYHGLVHDDDSQPTLSFASDFLEERGLVSSSSLSFFRFFPDAFDLVDSASFASRGTGFHTFAVDFVLSNHSKWDSSATEGPMSRSAQKPSGTIS